MPDESAATTSAATEESAVSVAALFAAVGALATGVVALDATGLIGQMERDHGLLFFGAVGAVIAGTFLTAIVASGLLGTDDPGPVGLRNAATQAAGEAADMKRQAWEQYGKAHDSAQADTAAAVAAARSAVEAADGTAGALRRVAAAADSIADLMRRGDEKAALKGQARVAYKEATPVNESALGKGSRSAAITTARAAAEHATLMALRASETTNMAYDAAALSVPAFRPWGRRRAFSRVAGACLIALGVGAACYAAVRAARDTAKPVIDVAIAPVKSPSDATAATRTYAIDAETKIRSLDSDSRITVLVDGLNYDAKTQTYIPRNLFHGKYGPDHDGAVDVHARLQVTRFVAVRGSRTATGYDAIGVQARVSHRDEKSEPNACGQYAAGLSARNEAQATNRADVLDGCVVMTLPGAITPEQSTSSTPVGGKAATTNSTAR